jgi:hypothetical protein
MLNVTDDGIQPGYHKDDTLFYKPVDFALVGTAVLRALVSRLRGAGQNLGR